MDRHVHRALAASIVAILAVLMPAAASAQALTQTLQVLPPGGNGCPILPLAGIVAHMNEGEINSFDVTVGNASYVAVLAEVGDTAVPFRYMTRFVHEGGFLRHHVDVDATAPGTGLPVSLTLLSSPQGGPTCLSIISFSVAADGTIMAPGMTSGPMKPVTDTVGGGSASPSKPVATSTTGSGTSTAPGVSPVAGGGLGRLQGLCDGKGALQLWFLLLAIYVVIAALAALAKPPLVQRSIWTPLALILVPLAALLALWLFAPSCRAAGWIPAASIIVAIGALLVAFREQNPAIKIIPLPAAKPSANTPVVTKSSTPVVTKTTPEVKPTQAKGK